LQAISDDNVDGQEQIRVVNGPLGRCTDDLITVMRLLSSHRMWDLDATIPKQPWDESIVASSQKLKIAVFTDDGFWKVSPAIERCVTEAAQGMLPANV
jgi:Asp-tRNA(Asn)/Glu-tRNA(Gln) amidotransferase A subunit family amidase